MSILALPTAMGGSFLNFEINSSIALSSSLESTTLFIMPSCFASSAVNVFEGNEYTHRLFDIQ
ncbi:hypothetical protein MBGDF03_00011 [Thermoplasmatales archaeon SCGC AB-540-F20]|nr:hypothetical protein MBGDF03_00011 [Thermoplasmatales archaeon SCGC AB-540-F20]